MQSLISLMNPFFSFKDERESKSVNSNFKIRVKMINLKFRFFEFSNEFVIMNHKILNLF